MVIMILSLTTHYDNDLLTDNDHGDNDPLTELIEKKHPGHFINWLAFAKVSSYINPTKTD